MNTGIMNLNNKIAQLQQEFEKVEDQKNSLKSEAEETTNKKLQKVTELSRVLMAIHNLEQRCLHRKEKSTLKYNLQTYTSMLEPKNFDKFVERVDYGKHQLRFIEQYLHDFREMVVMLERQKNEQKKPPVRRQEA